ncbi:feruloyl esterase B-like [Phragmites australis]|uniref:feruloyl esterase B-like n=1 Tax=Phragmites australis TaxID=29695 RepID=UPI002D78B41B|nr:feruloyl esterase B-like [Phragmites australis]
MEHGGMNQGAQRGGIPNQGLARGDGRGQGSFVGCGGFQLAIQGFHPSYGRRGYYGGYQGGRHPYGGCGGGRYPHQQQGHFGGRAGRNGIFQGGFVPIYGVQANQGHWGATTTGATTLVPPQVGVPVPVNHQGVREKGDVPVFQGIVPLANGGIQVNVVP